MNAAAHSVDIRLEEGNADLLHRQIGRPWKHFQVQHTVHRRRVHPTAGRITTPKASTWERAGSASFSESDPHRQRMEAAQPVYDGRRKRSRDEAARNSTGTPADGSARGQTPTADGAGTGLQEVKETRRQMLVQEELERQEAQRKERELRADGSPEEAARGAGSAARRRTAAHDSGTEQTMRIVLHGQPGAREAEAAGRVAHPLRRTPIRQRHQLGERLGETGVEGHSSRPRSDRRSESRIPARSTRALPTELRSCRQVSHHITNH